MSFILSRFSDFIRTRIFEEDQPSGGSSPTPDPFSSHWIDRTSIPGENEFRRGKSRIVPFDGGENPDGFVLKQNLLDSKGEIIQNLNLNDVISGSAFDFQELQTNLSRIFHKITRNIKIKDFLIQTENTSGLKANWGMFLGKICLINSPLSDQKLFLDFRWNRSDQSKIGGSIWGSGKGITPGAMTVLIYTLGTDGDFIYDQFIKKNFASGEIANKAGQRIERFPTKAEINSIQLLYPLGKNFTIEIDLEKNLFQIIGSIQSQIDSAKGEFPIIQKKVEKIEFVPQKIFDLFQENTIWFLDGDLVFKNEKIWTILDAIAEGNLLHWDANQKSYSSPNYIYTNEMLNQSRERMENFFFHFYEKFEKQKFSRVSLENINNQNYKKSFDDVKLCFENFKSKKGSDFKKMNSKMKERIELATENKNSFVFDFSYFLVEKKKNSKSGKNPCWSGYRQVGTKTKNGRLVPNCVPIGKTKTSLKENDEIEDMISGFEDLGINEKPKVWFIDWESNEDGNCRYLWIVEGYTRPEVILKIAETLNLEDGLDQEDWENFLNLVKEDENGIWGELVELVQESNYRGGEETLWGVNVMDHPKPSAIHLEPRSLTLYGEYNSSPENARLVREADRNLKSWFGLGLDSIQGLKTDHWI